MALVRRHGSDWFEVDIDRDARRVVVRRLERAFTSQEDAEHAAIPVLDVIAPLDRSKHTLLMDARQAPAINDPRYEEWYAPFRHAIVDGFARVAIVVRTASGKLHATRLAQRDRQEDALRIFVSHSEAQVYLDRA